MDPLKQRNDRRLLCPCLREKLEKLEALLDFPITVYETIRSKELQAHYLEIGASWTIRSLHLPQPPRGLALAFDAAPSSYLTLKAWNPLGPLWLAYGEAGESLGLTWGGRWRRRDKPHLQLSRCECPPEALLRPILHLGGGTVSNEGVAAGSL